MEILLVVPRYNYTIKPNFDYSFPIGLAYISAVIKNEGYSLDILNINHLEGTIEKIIKNALDSKNYDIVCSGNIGIGYVPIEKIINSVRGHQSKPLFILGGPIITASPKLIFNALKPDIGVIGEGERTIVELLNCIEKKSDLINVDGIIFSDEDKVIVTKPRAQIEDLNTLPFPDYDSFNYKELLSHMSYLSYPFGDIDSPRIYPILCSRGCPYHCTFCYHCLGTKYRVRSIDSIMMEISEAISRYGVNVIITYDDLFSANKERLFEFCKRIKKVFQNVQYKCEWSCQLSVHNIDKEILNTLKDSGCTSIGFGFESYSPIVLKSMKKPITPKMIDNAIKLSREANLNIIGNFIFGDVAETKETAKETLDYWKKNCEGQLQIYFIQPYPGSEIYDHCIKKGLIKDEINFIRNEMHHQNWFNMTQNMTDAEVLQLKKDILEARREYAYYIVPDKIEKNKDKKNRLDMIVECPFCEKKILYKNFPKLNRLHYSFRIYCKECHRSFKAVSRIYKFEMDNYNQLEFFRRNFLKVYDKFMKNRL